MSRQERVNGKGAALALVVGAEHDEDIFQSDDQGEGPDDERQSSEEIVVRRGGSEGGRVNIKRTGPYVAVDDAGGLVCQPVTSLDLE